MIQVSTWAGRGVHDTGEYMGGPRCTLYRRVHGRAEVYTIQASTRAGRGLHDTGEYMGGPRCTRYR